MAISVACSGFPPHAPLHVPSHPDAAKADDEKEMIIAAAIAQGKDGTLGATPCGYFSTQYSRKRSRYAWATERGRNLLQSRRVDQGKQKEERHENLRDAPEGKPAT